MKRKIYSLLLVLVLVIAGIVYYIFNKPHRNVESEKTSVRIMATDLFDRYSENEKLSDSLYLNEIVEVDGVILDVLKDQKGERMLVLEGGEMFGVVCSMDEKEAENKSRVDGLKPGAQVVLKGICTGFDSDVKLNKCVVVKEAEE